MVRVRLLVLVLITVLCAAVGRAAAATITVNTTFDGGLSGQCSLRQAIADVDSPGSNMSGCAPAAFGANTIVLGPHTYSLNGPIGLGSLPAPPPSELLIAPTVTNLTITGAGQRDTTIDATELFDRVFEISAGATVTISGLTIRGGIARPGPAGTSSGAGVGGNGGTILNAGALTLTDLAITHSSAGTGGPGAGGGAAMGGVGGAGGGGGIGGSGGAIYNTGTLTLEGATVADSRAGVGGPGGGGAGSAPTGGAGGGGGNGGSGGGIDNEGGTLTITDSTLSGNTSGGGGGGGNGAMGTATGGAGGVGGGAGAGGALYSSGGSVTITNSTIASNSTGGGGAGGGGGPGAVTGGAGGAGGAGGTGGAIAVTPATTLALQSDTIAGNSVGASGQGGAGGSAPTAGLAGAGGAKGVGGGLFDSGAFLTIQNTLLASDPGGNCDAPLLTNGGHNLSFGDSSCPSAFLSGDPNLGPLQDNGGPSATINLGTGSAALDQIPATGAGCQATDQRGVPRPSGTECDIGAYEVAPPSATTGKATAIKNTSATLNGTVTPNAGLSAVVAFEYGTTTKYGKSIAVANISGVSPVAVMVPIMRLKAGTTYHYRLTVTTIDGSANGGDETFTAGTAPVLSKLRVRGRTVTYKDSQAAKTTLKIVRGKGRHAKTVATFHHHDKKGANKVSFAKLHVKPGRYTLVATARFRGQIGSPVSVRIRIR